MLDVDEIAEIEKRMREEHARDLEALEAVKRLRKYLPEGDTPIKSETVPPSPPRTKEPRRRGLTQELRDIVSTQDETLRWTRASIEGELDRRGFEIRAKDKVAAINQSLRTLVIGGELRVVSLGSGSAPSVYGPPEPEGDEVAIPTPPPKENPAQSNGQGPLRGRKEQLARFLLTNGPASRMDISANAGLPKGTVSYCLKDQRFFEQVEGGNWKLTPRGGLLETGGDPNDV